MWEAPGRLMGRLLGGFREVPGRKAMSNLCVNPFKILHQSCFFAPGGFREAPGRKAMSNLCVNPFKSFHESCFLCSRELPGGSWEEGSFETYV